MSTSVVLDGRMSRRVLTDPPSGIRSVRIDPPNTRGYRAIAELLREPPDAQTLEEARAILGNEISRDPRLAPFAEALSRADASDARREWQRFGHALTCSDAGSELRAWACVASELAPGPSRTHDMLVMATLSERAAWAERTGSVALASALRDRRAAFVCTHGLACVGSLARALSEQSTPLLSSAGAALAALLAAETA